MAVQSPPDIPIYYQNNRLQNEFTDFNDIGMGGFGVVSSALHRIDLKRYAIKKIRLQDENDYFIKIRELQVWAKLDCSYFVQYRSSWLEKDKNNVINLYIQMDLCWFSMDKAIKKIRDYFEVKDRELLTQLPYYIVSELMIELLECVDYLHNYDPVIFHRDIKPDNILIRADRMNGRFLKLADFGLARFHVTDNSEGTYSKYVGTIRYMAPEITSTQSLNDPNKAKYGPKVDIFSIGVVFQEMFNYDLNRRTTDPTTLSEKYFQLGQLIDQMLSAQARTRPSCKDILDRRNEWAVNFNDISDDIREDIRARVVPNRVYDINQDFILYFLQTKLKYQK